MEEVPERPVALAQQKLTQSSSHPYLLQLPGYNHYLPEGRRGILFTISLYFKRKADETIEKYNWGALFDSVANSQRFNECMARRNYTVHLRVKRVQTQTTSTGKYRDS